MSDNEFRRSTVQVRILPNEIRRIPDSPELRALRRHMELCIRVLDARKRFLIFFKRKLNADERMALHMQLLADDYNVSTKD